MPKPLPQVSSSLQRLRLERGVVMAMKGDYEDAEQQFDLATRQTTQASLPFAALAVVRMQMNKLPEAISALRERRRLDGRGIYPLSMPRTH